MRKTNTNISSISFILILAAIAIFTINLTSCGKSDKDKAAPEMTVTVDQAKSETVPLYLDYVGTLQSIESVDINARVEGFLVERAFKDGADVKEGDLLFVIDPRPFEASLIAAKAQLSEDLAVLSYAREQVKRYKPLVEKDYITRDAYDEYVTQATEARAVVEADRANVVQAELDLSYCTMYAPFDGRIGRRLVDVGNLVGAGGESTLLATMVQLDPIYIYFNVAERDIPEIIKQQNTNPLTFSIVLPDESKHPQDGTIDFVDNQVDVTTGTITLRGVVPNTSKTLLPGQYAKVQLLLEQQPNTIVVPSQAIGEQQGDTFVYVVGSDNKVEFREVTAGGSYGEVRIIEKGLTAGETVIINGLQKVKPGITVKTETQAEADAKKKAAASPTPTGTKSK
ncbi:MAG: efflux RND transporter periplasmic adaptor subunit [Thermodesulfobacteriota bacterium]